MNINGHTRMAAVIANPIKHSLSPFIHNRAFELTQENGVYLAWEIAGAELTDKKDTLLCQALANIRLLDMYGVNLSMPYKQLAMWYVNDLAESAKLIGSINTIVNQKGQLIGYNTDGIGFWKFLATKNYQVTGENIVILGGGGAALAIITEAALKQANRIHVFARQSKSYKLLKKKLGTISEKTACSIMLHNLDNKVELSAILATASLLVNASSVGMDGIGMPVSPELLLPKNIEVVDIIYKVAQTPFLQWAVAQGAKTSNGVGMLLYQAAESFELWTGKKMPVEIIKQELEKKLK